MASARQAALLFASLAAACAAPAAAGASHAGAHDWISPFGSGRLELRDDASFYLVVDAAAARSRQEIAGEWRVGSHDCVTLIVRTVAPPVDWLPPGTEIGVLLGDRAATYLGLGGVIDLDWGY